MPGYFEEVRELVGPQQGFPAGRDVFIFGRGGSLDLVLDKSGFESRDITASVFDLFEQFPGLFGNRSRQVLDVIRSACGVAHLVEVRFLFQQ